MAGAQASLRRLRKLICAGSRGGENLKQRQASTEARPEFITLLGGVVPVWARPTRAQMCAWNSANAGDSASVGLPTVW
jgi:hypothetical protein